MKVHGIAETESAESAAPAPPNEAPDPCPSEGLGIDLATGVVHGGRAEPGADGILAVETPPGRWHYAISFPLPDPVRVPGARHEVRVWGRVLKGNVGIGVVDEGSSRYLREDQFTAGDEEFTVPIPQRLAERAHRLVVRNTTPNGVAALLEIGGIEIAPDQGTPPATLHEVTLRPFTPKARRLDGFKLASINTTEECNLSCVMCHFNGPQAVKKFGTLLPSQVEKVLRDLPSGDQVWFCATGEFFIDPNAVSYLRLAQSMGLEPCVLSHGQMFTAELMDQVLDAGVRFIRMSVDVVDPDQYRKIRRGGELVNVIDACKYFRRRKLEAYPGLRVEINATLFKKTFDDQRKMEDFWRGLVDQVNFNAEYFNTLQFRNLFFLPERRVDCDIQMYVLPSGRIAPCCALTVYQHAHDVRWLPHIDEVSSLKEAYDKLCDLYEDPNGPMAPICAKCDWWILSMSGASPYIRPVPLDSANS